MPERHQTMFLNRTALTIGYVLGSLTLPLLSALDTLPRPALAQTPMPPAKPAAACDQLAPARAEARSAAAGHGFDVVDLDGDNARNFLHGQDTPAALIVDHVTVLLNPRSGRAVMLLNDGPHCAFGSVATVDGKDTPPLETAINALRLAR